MSNIDDLIPKNLGQDENVKYPYKEKCPVILLLDSSSSMENGAIDELNKGVKAFKDELLKDNFAKKSVEIGIITFGDSPKFIQDFCLAEDWEYQNLTTSGTTALGSSINLGIEKLKERKLFLRQAGVNYFRPWLIAITDGYPTDMDRGDQLWNEVANNLRDQEWEKHSLPWVFGTEMADLSKLTELFGDNRTFKLSNANFKSIFLWLSDSVKIVSSSAQGDKIKVPTPEKYQDISIEI